MTFQLSEDDYLTLLFALGYAAGAASKEDTKLMWSFIRLTNAINKDRPGWTSYETPMRYRPPAPQAQPTPPTPPDPDPRDP